MLGDIVTYRDERGRILQYTVGLPGQKTKNATGENLKRLTEGAEKLAFPDEPISEDIDMDFSLTDAEGNPLEPIPDVYWDVNVIFPVLPVTMGIIRTRDGEDFPYLGLAAGSPGLSITMGVYSAATPGVSVGYQMSNWNAVQIGYSLGGGGSRYFEVGIGTPGMSVTAFWLWGPH